MFHVHLRRRCILLHLDGMSWRYQWDPSHLLFKTCVSLLILCFDDLSIGVSGVLKSPTIIVLLSIFPCMSVSVCLMYWGAPMLGFPCGSAGKESACNAGDLGSIPGLGRSPGEGKGYHSSILAWKISWTTVHGVAKSWTPLSDFHIPMLGAQIFATVMSSSWTDPLIIT